MSPARIAPVVLAVAILALGAFLMFGGGAEAPISPGGGTNVGDAPPATSGETGAAQRTDVADASVDRSAVRAPTDERALDPGILAALSGFRGRTVTPDGNPLSGVRVELYRFAADSVISAGVTPELTDARYEPDVDAGETRSDSAGEFELHGVWPRAFYLLRAGRGSDSVVLRVVERIPGPGEIVDLGDVVMEPSGVITGTVVDDEGEPVVGALVRAADIPGALLTMAPIEQFDPTGGIMIKPGGTRIVVAECPPWVERRFEDLPIPSTRTDGDGAFRLGGVVPGPNVVVVTARARLAHIEQRVKVAAAEERDLGTIRLREGETLYGRVVDQGGEPVAGAEVLAAPVGPIPVHFARFTDPTGDDGVFEMSGFPNQSVIVAARRSNRDPWVVLDPQPIISDIEVKLPSSFAITVTLTSEPGLPIEQPKFELIPGELGEGAVEMAMWGATSPIDLTERVERTEDGKWRIVDIPTGEFALLARCEGHALAAKGLEIEGSIEVELSLSAARTFDVHVVDAAGEPISSATVYVEARGSRPRIPEMPIQAGRTDENGRLHIDRVFANKARLTAAHPAYGNVHAEVSIPTDGPVVLRMEQPGILEGVLTEAGRPPKPGKWTLIVDRQWDGDDRGAMPNLPTMTVPGLEGEFRITGLRPGKYDIRPIDSISTIDSPGAIFAMVQSSRMMSFRQDHAFEIRSGETTTIEFDTEDERRIEGPTGHVTGTILVDGAPGVRLSVMTWGGGSRKVVDVDANGRFDLGQLAVGDQTLQVTELPDQNSLSMQFSPLWSEQVKVEENQIHDVTIRISLSSASGYVTDTKGASAGGMHVTLQRLGDSGRGSAWFHTATDDNGFFEFERIPAGRYELRAEDEFSRAERDDVIVEAGVPRADLRLALVRMQRVKGSVDAAPFGDSEHRWVWLRFQRVGDDGKIEASHWVGCDRDDYQFETTDLVPGNYKVGINGPNAPAGQSWVHDGVVAIGTADVEGLVIRPILQAP